jgi:hypothetical protein
MNYQTVYFLPTTRPYEMTGRPPMRDDFENNLNFE